MAQPDEDPSPEDDQTAAGAQDGSLAQWTGLGMVVGAVFGLLFGRLLFDNIGMGLALGMALGLPLGAGIGVQRSRAAGGEADAGDDLTGDDPGSASDDPGSGSGDDPDAGPGR